MDAPQLLSRRRLLGSYGTVAALGMLAGCVGDSGDQSDDSDDSNGSDDDSSDDDDDDSSDDDDDDDSSDDDDDSSDDDDDSSDDDDDDSSDDDDDDSSDDDSDDADEQNDDDNSDDDGPGELDRREANVVGVAFEDQGDSYPFDVALQHDDDGEDGYANWWQVERLDGTRLGRRELLHAHSNQPFTRSETIAIPADVGCVVVRGHDQTHEYGGRAALVNLDSGETRMVDQGPQRESFDADDCPE
jgi:hypothetical protein